MRRNRQKEKRNVENRVATVNQSSPSSIFAFILFKDATSVNVPLCDDKNDIFSRDDGW